MRRTLADFGAARTVAILAFAVLVAFPLAQIFQRAGTADPVPPDLWSTALFSARQAALSLVGALAVGIPLGSFYAPVWNRGLRGMITASFSLPALFVIGMMTTLLRGSADRFGLPSVVGAHVFLNAPWIALATAEGIRSVPRSWIEAARTLGADRRRIFLRIEGPWIARRVALAAAQVFALCVMSFAIVLVLGGGPPIVNLETEIYASVRGGGLSLTRAAWFAAAQLALAALPFLAVAGWRASTEYRDSLGARVGKRGNATPARRVIVHGIAAAWLILPGFFFLRSGRVADFGALLANEDLRVALGWSVRLGLFTAAATLALGVIFALGAGESRFVRALAAIPAGLSPLMIALGFFLAYSEWIDPFEGSLSGMVAVQATLFLPFALRFFLPLLEEERTGSRHDLRRAARTLGASPLRAWLKLEGPRWRSAAGRVGALVFVWSFSELAAASFFGSERIAPVGVLLLRWWAQYRFEDVNAVLFAIYVFSVFVLVVVGFGREEET